MSFRWFNEIHLNFICGAGFLIFSPQIKWKFVTRFSVRFKLLWKKSVFFGRKVKIFETRIFYKNSSSQQNFRNKNKCYKNWKLIFICGMKIRRLFKSLSWQYFYFCFCINFNNFRRIFNFEFFAFGATNEIFKKLGKSSNLRRVNDHPMVNKYHSSFR